MSALDVPPRAACSPRWRRWFPGHRTLSLSASSRRPRCRRWKALAILAIVTGRFSSAAKCRARYIASIIEDGSTLQIGLGRVPNEALRHLRDRRDLGIHSDVITDEVVDLIEAGVVTGRRKTRYRDRIVASYCLGTRRLYDFVDDNPLLAF